MGKKHGHGKHAHPGKSGPPAAGQPMGQSGGSGAPPGGIAAVMARADALLERERWAEARALLAPLAAQRPRDSGVLRALCTTYRGESNWSALMEACERLIQLDPGESTALLVLAEAQANDDHPALALRSARQFLARWPNDPQAGTARKLIDVLQPEVTARVRASTLSAEIGDEMMALHEQALALLSRGEYAHSRQTEERVLQRVPHFAPALNNISTAYALEGRLAQAISTAERVLARDPDNMHALGNVVAYLCRAGRGAAATDWVAKLKALKSPHPEAWIKKAEAFSYLGDDQAVMDAYEQVRQASEGLALTEHPLGLHLVAVAAWRLGREAEARRLWRRALKLAPNLEPARANLEDLRKPIGERHAPWPFGLSYWIGRQVLEDVVSASKTLADEDDSEQVGRGLRGALARHPELSGIVPLLLDHGDPISRGFALGLAQYATTPELLAALVEFALGQRGPDAMRLTAANAARACGAMPAGRVRLWMKGEWSESQLIGFEIYDEPDERHGPEVQDLIERGALALRENRFDEAVAAHRQAQAIEPDAPDVLNNLAASLGAQGHDAESDALIERIFREHPEYLFARLNQASLLVTQSRLAEAKALIDPILQRTRLHISEFRALARVQIEYWLADGKIDGARSWLDMWESVDPDEPALEGTRLRVAMAGMLYRTTRKQTTRWLPPPIIGANTTAAEEPAAVPPAAPPATTPPPRRSNLPSLKRSPGSHARNALTSPEGELHG